MHDLSTLFSVIQGFTQLAQGQVDDDPQLKSDLQQVLAATDRAQALAGTLSQAPGGEPESREPCDLGALARETIDLLRATLPAGVVLDLSEEVEEPIIRGDPVQIRRAILNVATNALNALPDRGGRVHVQIRAMRDYSPLGCLDTISLVVDDDGCGMNDEALRRVCDCLYTTRREAGGTGLGMWTVKRVLAAHGGFVHVQSVPQAGTTVRLAFPRLERRRAPDARSARALQSGPCGLSSPDDPRS